MKENRPIQYVYLDTCATRQKTLEAFLEYAALADKTNHAKVELIFTPLILAELTGGECFSKQDVLSSTKHLPRNIHSLFRQYSKYITVPPPSIVDIQHIDELHSEVMKFDSKNGVVGRVPEYEDMCAVISNYFNEHGHEKKRPAFTKNAGDESLIEHFKSFLGSVFNKIRPALNGNTNIEFVLVSNDDELQQTARHTALHNRASDKLVILGNRHSSESRWLKEQINSMTDEQLNADSSLHKKGILGILAMVDSVAANGISQGKLATISTGNIKH